MREELHRLRNSLEAMKNHLYLLKLDYPALQESESMKILEAEMQTLARLAQELSQFKASRT